jgi:hypothetical protein
MKYFPSTIFISILFSFIFQVSANPIYKQIFDLDYNNVNLKLNEGEESIERIYLEALNEFVFYISTGDTLIAEQYIQSYHSRIKRLNNVNEYDRLAIESEIDFMLATIYFTKNNYVKAAIPGLKSYLKNKKLLSDYPDRKLHKKLSGIFQIASATAPEDYSWILRITGFKGNVEKGIHLITEYASYEKEKYNSTFLSSVVLSILQTNFLNNYELANEILSKEENNQITLFLKARNYSKQGLNDEAINILQSYIKKNEQVKLTFLYYQLGSALLNKLDPHANYYLSTYLEKSKYGIFKRAVCLKLAWYYRIFIEEERFDYCKENFYKYQLGYNETDKQATIEMEKISNYNIYMLQSRLLFDGGYYKESFKMLQNVNHTSLDEVPMKIEYLYRYARLYHKLEEIDKAIKYYKNTISFGNKIPLYYASYSSFQLGLIYEDLMDYKNAAYFYNYCLTINHYQYKNSIEYKVNAALNRIENMNN